MPDIWRSFAAAVELLVMVPSLVQSLFPTFPISKRLRDVIRLPPQPNGGLTPNKSATLLTASVSARPFNPSRTMDDFLREVRRLFEAPLDPDDLMAMSAKLVAQFKVKLQASNICMLPSYNHTLPSGNEKGTFLALDCGGTSFRVAVVELNSQDDPDGECMRIVRMRSVKIGDAARALEGHAFFDWMAQRIEETLAEPEVQEHCAGKTMSMGLSWSFPVE
jgi:hexokinase